MKRSNKTNSSDENPSKKMKPLTTILETGHVFFFYRPKVEHKDEEHHIVHSLEDISKFYMILSPSESPCTHRLLILTGKMLPNVKKHDTRGAFVDLVSDKIEDLTSALEQKEYETVSGEGRLSPAARPCGEGIYEFVKHGKGHTHFVYELEIPEEPGPAQEALHICKSASYEIRVKNPNKPDKADSSGKGLHGKQKAHFTSKQMEQFRGTRVQWLRWADADPSFLDTKHAEFLLIGRGTDLYSEDETGELAKEIHHQEEVEMKDARKRFEKGHEEEKLYADLNVKENVLGPKESLTSGEFA